MAKNSKNRSVDHRAVTRFGFEWGAANVDRLMSDEGFGVVIAVHTTCGQVVNIRVTPSGRIRVGKVGKRVPTKNGGYTEKGAEIP
jgi:hypothetical protein